MTEKEIKEVKEIKALYETKEKSKLDELRELNLKAQRTPIIIAIIQGIIFSLILGSGTSLVITDVYDSNYIIGIIVGSIGLILCGANYFIYRKLASNSKKRYASLITTLADELIAE